MTSFKGYTRVDILNPSRRSIFESATHFLQQRKIKSQEGKLKNVNKFFASILSSNVHQED
jgi:hypothetical protein